MDTVHSILKIKRLAEYHEIHDAKSQRTEKEYGQQISGSLESAYLAVLIKVTVATVNPLVGPYDSVDTKGDDVEKHINQ